MKDSILVKDVKDDYKVISYYTSLLNKMLNDYGNSRNNSEFINDDNVMKFRMIVNTMEDTELIIENFLKYGFSGPTKYNDLGEKYLRIYGILSGVYNQGNSIIDLCRLFCEKASIGNLKDIKNKFKKLEIIETRNKLVAHSTSYKQNNNKQNNNKQYYSIVQVLIEDYDLSYAVDGKNIKVEFGPIIDDYLFFARKILGRIINNLVKNYDVNYDVNYAPLDLIVEI